MMTAPTVMRRARPRAQILLRNALKQAARLRADHEAPITRLQACADLNRSLAFVAYLLWCRRACSLVIARLVICAASAPLA